MTTVRELLSVWLWVGPLAWTAAPCAVSAWLGATSRRTSKTWRASSTLGVAMKAPRAGSSVTRRSRLRRLSACRTTVRDTENTSAICCSTNLVPGISRRSTMASVIASAIWSVVLAEAAPSGGRAASGSTRRSEAAGLRGTFWRSITP